MWTKLNMLWLNVILALKHFINDTQYVRTFTVMTLCSFVYYIHLFTLSESRNWCKSVNANRQFTNVILVRYITKTTVTFSVFSRHCNLFSQRLEQKKIDFLWRYLRRLSEPTVFVCMYLLPGYCVELFWFIACFLPSCMVNKVESPYYTTPTATSRTSQQTYFSVVRTFWQHFATTPT